MLADLWERRDALVARLEDASWQGDRDAALVELNELEAALGIAEASPTGDPLSDYLMSRQMDGTITPEDLELTPEDFAEMQKGRR